jgi:hypothetical protein
LVSLISILLVLVRIPSLLLVTLIVVGFYRHVSPLVAALTASSWAVTTTLLAALLSFWIIFGALFGQLFALD